MGMTHWRLRATALGAWLAAGALVGGSGTAVAQEVACTDGADDDGDTQVDCWDSDCDPVCLQTITRNFAAIVPPDVPQPFRNIYYVSLSEHPRIEDVANLDTWGVDGPCVGVGLGDGLLDSYDLLCSIWSRSGGISVERFLPAVCSWDNSSLHWDELFSTVLPSGSRFPLEARGSYRITAYSDGGVIDNPATLQGWCDDSSSPIVVARTTICRPWRLLLPIPYDTTITSVDEVLCGREGFDWTDADGDGAPDTCPNGIFDGSSAITVLTFDNDPVSSRATDNLFVARTVLLTDLGLAFLGDDFPVSPGDSVEVRLTRDHRPTLWAPEHAAPCR